MAIIFIHNLQNRKSCKVIVRYLAEISVYADVYVYAVYADDNTPNATGDCVTISRKSLKNIVSYVQFVIFNPWKLPWS